MNYKEWLNIGIESGFVTEELCVTHIGYNIDALNEEQLKELDEDEDPCIFVLQVKSGH